MKTKISPTVVGLFVLGAILLGVIALFSFGGVNFFSKPERFVVYFNESIHGLDQGSPVKLRGVRIGRVVGMKVRAIPGVSADEPRSVVAVVCELSRDVVANAAGEPVDVSDRGELQQLVDQGCAPSSASSATPPACFTWSSISMTPNPIRRVRATVPGRSISSSRRCPRRAPSSCAVWRRF